MTDVVGTVQMIALEQIRHDENVRQELLPAEVDQLAQPIALLGQLTPVSVRPDGANGYVLIAGHKRYAALEQLGHAEIRAEIRPDDGGEASERAAENIVRSELNAYEEGVAVKAMLDRGLSESGAATALGWPKARVTARLRLLELPEVAQQMVGAGAIPLSSVDQLRAIDKVSPELLDALIAFLVDGNAWAAERLAREPGWVLDSALRDGDSKVFAEHLTTVNTYRIADLRLGKKTDQLLEQAGELHKKIDRYAYGLPSIRFAEEEIDQARAANVVIEFERSAPIIVDRPLYRELCKQAIKRTVAELEAKLAAREEERKTARRSSRESGVHEDPAADAKREEGRQLRELAEQAHGVNLDLGASLLTGLSTVDPADLQVARFFCFAVLGSDHDDSPYTQTGERVARLAVSGIRLVIDEFRTDVTKTKKDGSRGALRIDYGDAKQPSDPIAWMWKFIDGARTAGELYGRTLMVIAAEQHASRLVVPSSQRGPGIRWSSHKDKAAKALTKLVGPHLPASLKQLERAVTRVHAEREQAIRSPDQTADAVPSDPAADLRVASESNVITEDRSDNTEVDDIDFDIDDDLRDVGGVVGADGAVYSDADPGL
jgi:ParB/RepB/Spo0J family partition protein